jgi:hypothetical protein
MKNRQDRKLHPISENKLRGRIQELFDIRLTAH